MNGRVRAGSERQRRPGSLVAPDGSGAARKLRPGLIKAPGPRGRYWLELHGNPLHRENKEIPPALATDVFETQEKLEELRTKATPALHDEVRHVHDALVARLAGLEAELSRLYAGANGNGMVDELKRRLSEIAYLRTLLGDVEAALGEVSGAHSRH